MRGSAEARAAGLAAHTVSARRAINSRASGRGTVREYVVTNVRRSGLRRADSCKLTRSERT